MYLIILAYCLLPIAYCLLPMPTALCSDSVMPRQRYAFPALCLAATGGCLPKITTCPRNRKID